MNNKNSFSFQYLLQSFFQQRLIQHKKVSGQTINSYRDSFKIYVKFLMEEYNVQPTSIHLGHLDREHIVEFCKYLEIKRKKTVLQQLTTVYQ